MSKLNKKDVPQDNTPCKKQSSKLVGIDAVRLFLPNKFYRISSYNKLKFNGTGLRWQPSAEERRDGFHSLNVSINRWGMVINVNLPKLVFGDNIQEITEDHLKTVVDLIRIHLQEIGIEVLPGFEKALSVTYLEIGKNIVSYGTPISYVLTFLKRAIDVKGRKKTGSITYLNEAGMLTIGNKQKLLVFYDKAKEVSAFEAHRSGKDDLPLVDFIARLAEQNAEILRVELRLTRLAVKKMFEHLGVRNPCLSDLFNGTLMHNTLEKAWQEIPLSSEIIGEDDEGSAELLLEQIIRSNPKNRAIDALARLGLSELEKTLAKTEIRKILMSLVGKPKARYLLKKLAKGAKVEPTMLGRNYHVYDNIVLTLEGWEPLSTSSAV